MRKLLVAFVLCFFFTLPAMGQSMQSFVHDFGDFKVYHTFAQIESVTFVETAKIQDGVCKKVFVSPVDIKDTRVVFSGGTVWKLRKAEDGIEVETPLDDGLLFKPAKLDPVKLCAEKKRET